MHNQKPRKPTAEETEQLVKHLMRDERDPSPEAQAFAKRTVDLAAIAMFDHYVRHGGEEIEKLMTVIWPGHRSCHAVYVWRDGSPEPVKQNPDFHREMDE